MVVLFTYQQLVERNSDQIHVCWKLTVISMCLLAVATGISSAYSMGTLVNLFEGRCILEANLTFANKSELFALRELHLRTEHDLFRHVKHVHVKHGRISSDPFGSDPGVNNTYGMMLDLSNSEWNNIQLCEWYQLASVMSAVMGVVWLTFFTMCSRGGRVSVGLPNPSRLVLPSIPCFLILGVCGIASSTELNHGMWHFCTEFRSILDVYECGPETDRFTPSVGETVPAHVLIRIAVAGSWLGASSWILAFTILLLRVLFMVDFDLITITVSTKPESGSSVTNQAYMYRTASNEGILRVHDPRASLDAVRLRVVPVVKSKQIQPAIIQSPECSIPHMDKLHSPLTKPRWLTVARRLGLKRSKSDIIAKIQPLAFTSSEKEIHSFDFEGPKKKDDYTSTEEPEKIQMSVRYDEEEPPAKKSKEDKSFGTHDDELSSGVLTRPNDDGDLTSSPEFKAAINRVIGDLINTAIEKRIEEMFSQTSPGTIVPHRTDATLFDDRVGDVLDIGSEQQIREWSAGIEEETDQVVDEKEERLTNIIEPEWDQPTPKLESEDPAPEDSKIVGSHLSFTESDFDRDIFTGNQNLANGIQGTEESFQNILPDISEYSRSSKIYMPNEIPSDIQNEPIPDRRPTHFSKNYGVSEKEGAYHFNADGIPGPSRSYEDFSQVIGRKAEGSEIDNIENELLTILPDENEFPKLEDLNEKEKEEKTQPDNERTNRVAFIEDGVERQSGPSSSVPPSTKPDDEKSNKDNDDDTIDDEVAQIFPFTFAAFKELQRKEKERKEAEKKTKEDHDKDKEEK